MSTARYLPPVSIAVAIGRLFSGRIRFSGGRVGKTLTMENGEVHTVFREVLVASSASVPSPSMTLLKVRFQFARFSPAANRRLSLLPVPPFSALFPVSTAVREGGAGKREKGTGYPARSLRCGRARGSVAIPAVSSPANPAVASG